MSRTQSGKLLIRMCGYGGRDRTRPYDLLRVKENHPRGYFGGHCLPFGIGAGASICPRGALPIRGYGPAEGFPSKTVEAITRDSRGFLWFSTREGLAQFDGYEFRTYAKANGLRRDTVEDFLETRSGIYRAATTDGVARFDPDAPAVKNLRFTFPIGKKRDASTCFIKIDQGESGAGPKMRNADAAKRLFRRALGDRSHPQPRVINTDLAPIYSSAISDIKKDGVLRSRCRHRPVQYLNNILEQDQRRSSSE